jgi:hypothetical protein
MAGKAHPEDYLEYPEQHPEDPRRPIPVPDGIPGTKVTWNDLRETVAQMYGRGIPRKVIARTLVDYLVPNNRHRPLEQRLSQARQKLRNWEHTLEFRDRVYEIALVELDLESPAILKGLAKKAKRGRVDAARLAMELTGRHNPKGDAAPTQVAVVFNGIPRPDGDPAVEVQAVRARPELEVPPELRMGNRKPGRKPKAKE